MRTLITTLLIIGLSFTEMYGQSEVPVGTILIWSGPSSTIPNGWKICDGDYLLVTAYPELHKVVQDYWGPYRESNSGHAISYKLPDLRGIFIRGVNDARNDSFEDKDKDKRESTKGTPNEVGSFQRHAIQTHSHRIGEGTSDKQANSQRERTRFADFYKEKNGTPHTTSDPISANLSSETRPNNAYVHYIIKAE
ncbi:phage tail protein [Allomuricauda sp. SCSIO 65647]|uniref:phage tail protein n=1 Tax=Allomuricauda sp. SCSIO 65647 TaxID=2908843 RepID=UPI001F1C760F|nr:phage tail protein [Muricauda sp. SCSIO 65647]UJH68806.1 phage tail protein [Muricauda sp. SCSIO 65647]